MNSPNLDTIYAWCPICEMICSPDETDANYIHIGCGAQTEDVHVVSTASIDTLTAEVERLKAELSEAVGLLDETEVALAGIIDYCWMNTNGVGIAGDVILIRDKARAFVTTITTDTKPEAIPK